MSESPAGRTARVHPRAGGRTGCLLAGLGATTGALVWAPRAALRVDGGFEGHARDLGVLLVDLPLIVLGGVLVPLLARALVARWVPRPWLAALAAVAVLALAAWGLAEWYAPRHRPDPGYGPGI
ncbi:hypothetical protein ACFWOG_01835 [Kitasatospora sp. NPDC058406]|uniref:hypothetical protein n=1 Tax=Kitasatospora sp. NPDC058406 TaxID=3346483 RepID=UPI00365AC0DF